MPKPLTLLALLLLTAPAARADDAVWPPPASATPAPPPTDTTWPPPAPPAPASPAADPWSAGASTEDPWGTGAPTAPPQAPPPPPAYPPPAAATASPWSGSPAVPAPPPAAPPETPELAGREVREVWNSAGLLTRRLVLDRGTLVMEVSRTYDAAGLPVEERTVSGGSLVVQTWTYNEDGTTAAHAVVADGVTTLSESFTYEDGKVRTRTVTTPDAGTSITTTTYGPTGEAVLVETRGADGALLSRTVSDREPLPFTPAKLAIKVSGGVATSSDVQTTAMTAGFAITRDPPPSTYDRDPIELAITGSYLRSSSAGELTNDQLDGRVGVDYNELVGPLTAFVFTQMSRNPVANLDIDLLAAPIGFKYTFVETPVFVFDASFAPVWNFRSITIGAGDVCEAGEVTEDAHCAFSKLRGSLRVRATLGNSVVKVKDTLEFLPTLDGGGNFFTKVEDEAILRNTLTLDVRLTSHFGLSESIVFTRDPLLAAQAECTARSEELLCQGMSLQTGSQLSLWYQF